MARSINQLKNEARREEQRENWSRAIELYSEAIRRSEEGGEVAPDLSLYNRIGDLHRRQGDIDAAVHYYTEAVDRYAEQGLHTGAIALCNKILRIDPDQVEVHRDLGRLHVATGLVAEARNSFLEYTSRMEERGEDEKALEAKTELARLTGDEDLHLECVDELIRREEEAEAVRELVTLWKRRMAAGDEERADEYKEWALGLDPDLDLEAETETEPEPARDEEDSGADQAVEGPALDDLMLELDEAQEVARDGDLASLPAEEFSDDDLDDAEVQLRYGEVLARSGQTGAAIEQLESAVQRFEAQGRLAEALGAVDRLLDVGSGRTAHLRKRASLLEALGDEEGAAAAYLALGRSLGGPGAAAARKAYARALELSPELDEAREALASVPGGGGDPHERRVDLTEVLAETSARPSEERGGAEDGDRYVDLGERIRRRLGDEEEAEATEPSEAGAESFDFDGMLVGFRARVAETVGEADPSAHVELGVALRQMGLLDDAIREFQIATRGQDPPLRAFELLGECFIEKEHHSVAIRVLRRAARLPGHNDFDLLGVLYQLGVAHQEVDDLEQARECFERVYSVDIDFRDVAERMEAVSA